MQGLKSGNKLYTEVCSLKASQWGADKVPSIVCYWHEHGHIKHSQIHRNGRVFSRSGSEERESLPLVQEQMLGMINHQSKPVSLEAPNHSFPGWLQPRVVHLQKPLEISKPSSLSFTSIQQACLLTQPYVMNKLSVCAAGTSPSKSMAHRIPTLLYMHLRACAFFITSFP